VLLKRFEAVVDRLILAELLVVPTELKADVVVCVLEKLVVEDPHVQNTLVDMLGAAEEVVKKEPAWPRHLLIVSDEH
jgi:hypothetical protein